MIEQRPIQQLRLYSRTMVLASLLAAARPALAVDFFRQYDPDPPVLTAPPVRVFSGLPYADPDPEPPGTRLVLYKIGSRVDPDPIFPSLRFARSMTGGVVVASAPSLLGACCFGGTVCSDVDPQSACEAAGGLWGGNGTSCSDVPSPCIAVLGACCMGSSCQDDQAPASCLGTFKGSGTHCADVPPPCVQIAACCVAGTCTETLASQCEAAGGIFSPLFTSCAGDPCSGACCLNGGGCSHEPPSSCFGFHHGSYLGGGTNCAAPPVSCASLLGACCAAGTCTDATTYEWCTQVAIGTWGGAGSACPIPPC